MPHNLVTTLHINDMAASSSSSKVKLSLDTLPHEVVASIFSFVSPDLKPAMQVNRFFREHVPLMTPSLTATIDPDNGGVDSSKVLPVLEARSKFGGYDGLRLKMGNYFSSYFVVDVVNRLLQDMQPYTLLRLGLQHLSMQDMESITPLRLATLLEGLPSLISLELHKCHWHSSNNIWEYGCSTKEALAEDASVLPRVTHAKLQSLTLSVLVGGGMALPLAQFPSLRSLSVDKQSLQWEELPGHITHLRILNSPDSSGFRASKEKDTVGAAGRHVLQLEVSNWPLDEQHLRPMQRLNTLILPDAACTSEELVAVCRALPALQHMRFGSLNFRCSPSPHQLALPRQVDVHVRVVRIYDLQHAWGWHPLLQLLRVHVSTGVEFTIADGLPSQGAAVAAAATQPPFQMTLPTQYTMRVSGLDNLTPDTARMHLAPLLARAGAGQAAVCTAVSISNCNRPTLRTQQARTLAKLFVGQARNLYVMYGSSGSAGFEQAVKLVMPHAQITYADDT